MLFWNNPIICIVFVFLFNKLGFKLTDKLWITWPSWTTFSVNFDSKILKKLLSRSLISSASFIHYSYNWMVKWSSGIKKMRFNNVFFWKTRNTNFKNLQISLTRVVFSLVQLGYWNCFLSICLLSVRIRFENFDLIFQYLFQFDTEFKYWFDFKKKLCWYGWLLISNALKCFAVLVIIYLCYFDMFGRLMDLYSQKIDRTHYCSLV